MGVREMQAALESDRHHRIRAIVSEQEVETIILLMKNQIRLWSVLFGLALPGDTVSKRFSIAIKQKTA